MTTVGHGTANIIESWDITDGAWTQDYTPGVDDGPVDALDLPDAEVWEVMTDGNDPERMWRNDDRQNCDSGTFCDPNDY